MSGLFGIVSAKDCRQPLFYGTDYHSHLGTKKAGLAVLNHRITRCIHDISTSQFKSKFIEELPSLSLFPAPMATLQLLLPVFCAIRIN